MEYLKQLDRDLFISLNKQHTPFWDAVMFNISDKYFWIPVYILLLAFLIYTFRRKSYVLVVFIALTVAAADQLASTLLKPGVARLRPCHDAELAKVVIIVNNHCGGKYGFVSSHAAIYFALAMLLSLILPPKYRFIKIISFVCAAVVAYSRVYLGVHFPGDVIAGGLLGLIVGGIFGILFQKLLAKYYPAPPQQST